jgi:hypothetical protein
MVIQVCRSPECLDRATGPLLPAIRTASNARDEEFKIPDEEFVAATMGEEFSLPCPLDSLF